MANVYSTVFFDGFPLSGQVLVAPPDGFVYVLRDGRFTPPGAFPQRLTNGALLLGTFGSPIWSKDFVELDAGVTYAWGGHQAFAPGETATWQSDVDTWQVRLSGYALTLP